MCPASALGSCPELPWGCCVPTTRTRRSRSGRFAASGRAQLWRRLWLPGPLTPVPHGYCLQVSRRYALGDPPGRRPGRKQEHPMIGASLRDAPERFYQFRMSRHYAGTASLAVPHRNGGRRSRKVQVPPFQLQRFRLPQRGAPQQQGRTARYANRSSGRSYCDGSDQINRGLLALGTSRKTRRTRSNVINASTVKPQPTSLVRIILSCARSPSSRRGYTVPPTVPSARAARMVSAAAKRTTGAESLLVEPLSASGLANQIKSMIDNQTHIDGPDRRPVFF